MFSFGKVFRIRIHFYADLKSALRINTNAVVTNLDPRERLLKCTYRNLNLNAISDTPVR
jgi:hypothetical protein